MISSRLTFTSSVPHLASFMSVRHAHFGRRILPSDVQTRPFVPWWWRLSRFNGGTLEQRLAVRHDFLALLHWIIVKLDHTLPAPASTNIWFRNTVRHFDSSFPLQTKIWHDSLPGETTLSEVHSGCRFCQSFGWARRTWQWSAPLLCSSCGHSLASASKTETYHSLKFSPVRRSEEKWKVIDNPSL